MTWKRWHWEDDDLDVVSLLKRNNVWNSVMSFGLSRYHPAVQTMTALSIIWTYKGTDTICGIGDATDSDEDEFWCESLGLQTVCLPMDANLVQCNKEYTFYEIKMMK